MVVRPEVQQTLSESEAVRKRTERELEAFLGQAMKQNVDVVRHTNEPSVPRKPRRSGPGEK